jgi:eukaryotic-like serine/threonine-protein kinase
MAPELTSADRSGIYRFRIDRLAGRGGTGSVYRAVDTANGQVVAVKIFAHTFFRNRLHVRDFSKSVSKFKKWDHPNVVKVLEFIAGEEGNCLVQEFVDGPDLKWYITERPWNLPERMVICAQICNGLQYIHEQGFTHNDFKPSNVLFTRKGQVKLSDYSLARQGLIPIFGTGIGEMMTPMYVAPELIEKKKPTPQSDIYALGITFYLMFSGKHPFETDNIQRLYQCHLKVVPMHPTTYNDACPPVLGDIIMKMIDKKPENRFENCDQLRIAIQDIGRSRL